MTPAEIRHLVVVVPVRNEARLLPRALDHLERSVAQLVHGGDAPAVRIVVADDGSGDGSRQLAESRSGVEVISGSWRSVGASRAAGVNAVLGQAEAATTWIATTDGDSAVPLGWAAVHLELARAGAGAVLGSIRPDPADLSLQQLERWHELNPQREEHSYIHGANLGVRGNLYLAVGGFRPMLVDEDVDLIDRLRGQGVEVRSTDRVPVLTSARASGRAPGGFARYVRTALSLRPHRTSAGVGRTASD
jgi:glycosyltransferase involved in cell wall biosynthesis